MLQKGLIILTGIIAGVVFGIFLIGKTNIANTVITQDNHKLLKKHIIGFLPFWLIDKAQADYSKYITQLSYFNIVINGEGNIQKFTSPGESDPGWHALFTGRVDDYLTSAKSQGNSLACTRRCTSPDQIRWPAPGRRSRAHSPSRLSDPRLRAVWVGSR